MTRPRDEEGLDPESWDAMRALGHRMVDDMMGYLEQVRDRPAWQPVPDRTLLTAAGTDLTLGAL